MLLLKKTMFIHHALPENVYVTRGQIFYGSLQVEGILFGDIISLSLYSVFQTSVFTPINSRSISSPIGSN
jgi:hypothetical protein